MEFLVICSATLVIAILSLFSGFGLGTLLLPIFALFFPLPVAIASTAIVHLANNLFKGALVGRLANWKVVVKFGFPAIIAAAIGAYLLGEAAHRQPIAEYSVLDHHFAISITGMIIGLMTIVAALFELIPSLSKVSFPAKYIPLGGALSGFFGGLSGHQGMLRSAFLIKAGLNKDEFVGTGVICSIAVDVIRLVVYGWSYYTTRMAQSFTQDTQWILLAACFTAFLGSYIGTLLLKRITFRTIQLIVGIMLLFLGFAIAIGL